MQLGSTRRFRTTAGQLLSSGCLRQSGTGLFKERVMGPNAFALFICVIAKCCPDFTWTSLEVVVDAQSPLHRDVHNLPTGTLQTHNSPSTREGNFG